MSFQNNCFHFWCIRFCIQIMIQKNKLLEMNVVDFDPTDAQKSYDGLDRTYKAPQSDDQSPKQKKGQSPSSQPIKKISRGLSVNNCVRRTVTAIKTMNKNVIKQLKDSPLNNIIKQVWLQFKENPIRCKQILMVLFNNQPDPVMMASFGFEEWAKEQNFSKYKRAMVKLKRLILGNMTHQTIRLYLLDRKRIKQLNQPMFRSYIWKFIDGDFRRGTIKKVHRRWEILLIREKREIESREDEEIKMVISSGSQVQVHFLNNKETYEYS